MSREGGWNACIHKDTTQRAMLRDPTAVSMVAGDAEAYFRSTTSKKAAPPTRKLYAVFADAIK